MERNLPALRQMASKRRLKVKLLNILDDRLMRLFAKQMLVVFVGTPARSRLRSGSDQRQNFWNWKFNIHGLLPGRHKAFDDQNKLWWMQVAISIVRLMNLGRWLEAGVRRSAEATCFPNEISMFLKLQRKSIGFRLKKRQWGWSTEKWESDYFGRSGWLFCSFSESRTTYFDYFVLNILQSSTKLRSATKCCSSLRVQSSPKIEC